MVRTAPQGAGKPTTAFLPCIACPDKGHQGCCRNGGLHFCKAQDDQLRFVGNRQGIQRRSLQKPVELVRKLGRDPDVGLKGTPKHAPASRLHDEMAAGRDPNAPSRQPTLEIRYHGAVWTDDKTYELPEGAHLAGCDAQSLPRRRSGVRLMDRYGMFRQFLHGAPSQRV